MTEIVGDANAGKTSFCLSIVCAALTGPKSHVVYLNVGSSEFPSARLLQFATHRFKLANEQAKHQFVSRVQVPKPKSVYELNEEYAASGS